jgi:hypothetical protein
LVLAPFTEANDDRSLKKTTMILFNDLVADRQIAVTAF